MYSYVIWAEYYFHAGMKSWGYKVLFFGKYQLGAEKQWKKAKCVLGNIRKEIYSEKENIVSLHIRGLPTPRIPMCMSSSQKRKLYFLLAPHVNALTSNRNVLFQVELELD